MNREMSLLRDKRSPLIIYINACRISIDGQNLFNDTASVSNGKFGDSLASLLDAMYCMHRACNE